MWNVLGRSRHWTPSLARNFQRCARPRLQIPRQYPKWFSRSSVPPLQRPSASPSSSIPGYVWATVGGTGVLLGYTYYAHLDAAPLTGRRRWIVSTPEWEQRMGDEEYRKLLKQWKSQILPANHRASVTLQRVGDRLARAAQQFAREQEKQQQQRYLSKICERPFTFTVIRADDTANAFVLPGNHVFVLTGLFQYVRDEDDLAAVLGHELAHTLARHAGERISGSLITNLLTAVFLWVDPTGGLAGWIVRPTLSVLRELPNSRQQETEADQIGLHLAAYACYDPRAAHRVFEGMAAQQRNGSNTSAPPEFLSTHPSHDSRLHDLEIFLPAALERIDHEECRTVRQHMKEARKAAAAAQRH